MQLRRSVTSFLLVLSLTTALAAQSASRNGRDLIKAGDAQEWLAYLASDELQGRATFTEGLGLAAGYIAQHLKEWGVKPAGDNGTYFQIVKVHGVRTTSRSTVTVEVNGERRTFKDGEGISLPRNMGGPQQVTAREVVFAGYGLSVPASGYDDYARLDVNGKAVIWLGNQAPEAAGENVGRLLRGRSRAALERGAIATVGPAFQGGGPGGRGAAGRGGQPPAGRGGRGGAQPEDFTTVQRLDQKIPPAVTAEDEFFEFLFSGSDISYADLKARAEKREPLPPFALKGVTLTFNIDADYQIVRTRLTRNVVGIVEGSDPALKNTYVVYGAHYDHTGYREVAPQGDGPADVINNGADDDGSGTVGLMTIAKAFAQGPRPKRSILFVWHAGEESGLLGSRYNADYPVVPLESMVAQINMDMIGRNRDDDPGMANTVFVVGSDRISTELHNINEDANASLPKPLTLDYEYNDPADPQSFYTRSDHYSYAAKGIPIIFFFTGTHPDYHRPTDHVDKILFDKLVRVAQLAYETGRRVADMERMPIRDNKGARVGKTVKGKLPVETTSGAGR